MRYEVIRRVRDTGEHKGWGESRNRAEADALYQEQKGKLEPGEEVVERDTQKDIVLDQFYKATAEERREEAQRYFERNLSRMVEDGEEALTKFAAKIAAAVEKKDSDPLYDLEWADSSFDAAGKLCVARAVRYWLKEGESYEKIFERLTEKVLQGAEYPSRSTSQSHNLAAASKLAAWAYMRKRLGEVMSYI